MKNKSVKKLSIYLHIPFCVRKCRYCDFLSFPAPEEQKTAYVQALLKEIETEAPRYKEYIVDTVFIGGGTPSLLSGEQTMQLLNTLRRFFCVKKDAEITIEVNPGTVDARSLRTYRRAGINRLSIGTQSVHDNELAYLGRIHRAEDFFRTYQEARDAGFQNINVDVMAALPGQSAEIYMDNLAQIAALEPEHISAYSLIIEENTDFYELYGGEKKVSEQLPALPSEEEERRMDKQTECFLQAHGYYRYEISNYAKMGRECAHNRAYWERKNYAGFGIGAASMVENVRWKNTTDIERYIEIMRAAEQVRETETTSALWEEVTVLRLQEQMEEFMFLGLRLTEGVSAAAFARTFGVPIEEIYGTVLKRLREQGLLETSERIRLTPYGRDISNYVMAEFLLDI